MNHRKNRHLQDKYRLSHEQLYLRCDPDQLGFETTRDLPPWNGTLDQKDALDAIDFGLSIKSRGFNIYAVGQPGFGKTSTILRLVRNRARKDHIPPDICYLYNFEDPYEPQAVLLPSGKGRKLAELIEGLALDLRRETQRIVMHPSAQQHQQKRVDEYRTQIQGLLSGMVAEATALGFELRSSDEQGFVPVIPYQDGFVGEAELREMAPSPETAALREQMVNAVNELERMLHDLDRRQRQLMKELVGVIIEDQRAKLSPMVERLMIEVREKLGVKNKLLDTYMGGLKSRYLEYFQRFLPHDEEENEEESGKDKGESDEESEFLNEMEIEHDQEEIPIEFRVNVLVDNSKETSAPVIMEKVPTYANLVGYLEYQDKLGAFSTNHTLVRPGALHRANGGYLILQANDILLHPMSWFALKKVLRHKEIRIEEMQEEGRPRVTGTVRPKSVPLDLKVILVGNDDTYYLLQNHDEEFNRLFKVKSDFSHSMARLPENVHALACFLGQIAKEEKYLPVHARAVARIVEYSSYMADDQEMISNRTSSLIDLLAESDFWAHQRQKRPRFIDARDVDKALEDRSRRHSRIEKLALREIQSGTVLIDTTGEVVGQINGMAVYDLGDHAFGIPSRITAITYAGDKGITNIDREVNLSGNIHDKGTLIMTGYISGRFARNKPMNLSSSITFEQTYNQVEGDSASSTELYALLSSLADVPIHQSIAVTGSVNQQGYIQAIGGVNEKIEGFYKVCKLLGTLDGSQGVLIPKANVRNLMLPHEVVEAVRDGLFHVFAISHIDEGVEILMNMSAGDQHGDGTWTPGSFNDRVARRIEELSLAFQKSQSDGDWSAS
ncbi:MAG: ATP-dependent protease [Deltaproteobacteria bacterium HGW-Deltaproteobacteria-17]|nr:MAG: ATP-dependent protease [Deltaproteobacteria bacterium HGW-Deltaproteobacteria-17]